MKVQELTKEKFIQVMKKVEDSLDKTHPTKRQVVQTLSDLGYCSPKSSGFERSFLKVGVGHGFVTPKFAALMGVRPSTTTPETTHPWIGKPTVQAINPTSLPDVPSAQSTKNPVARRLVAATPQFTLVGLNPPAVSVVTFFKETTVFFKDGSEQPKSALTRSSLENACTVVSLGN